MLRLALLRASIAALLLLNLPACGSDSATRAKPTAPAAAGASRSAANRKPEKLLQPAVRAPLPRSALPKHLPNVVLMMVDDMGFSDIGAYGGEVRTPNLDRLAGEGIRFTQFYNAAKCEPTRASLMSGQFHRQVGTAALRNSMTLAELLRDAGYTTLMTGKWHLTGSPMDRGFDRYFGHLSGATNFFKGDDTFRLDHQPFAVPTTGFYTTDANIDYAIRFLEDSVKPDKPFFLYIAHNAPHYPLHAWEADTAKYRGRFMEGWDVLREKRWRRMVDMGLISADWKLPPRETGIEAWADLTPAEQEREDYVMAVYAAMIDRVDQTLGRLLAHLDSMGVRENTLFFFLSDNGACPFQRSKSREHPPGHPESRWTLHAGWAQLSNTPLRLYKQNQHEGGISTPLIVHWPAVIPQGRIERDHIGHITDFMATFVDLTGAAYPEEYNGTKLGPLRGASLLPAILGHAPNKERAIYGEFQNRSRAMRVGKWKASWVNERWELYDIEADRTEMNDLASRMPEKVEALDALFDEMWQQQAGKLRWQQKHKPHSFWRVPRAPRRRR